MQKVKKGLAAARRKPPLSRQLSWPDEFVNAVQVLAGSRVEQGICCCMLPPWWLLDLAH